MTMDPHTSETHSAAGFADEARVPAGGRKSRNLIIAVIALAIVGAGIFGASRLIATAPKVQRRPPAKIVPLVRVQPIFPGLQQVVIRAMGTVVPARVLTLKSRVAGEVVRTHPEFIEGGLLRRDAPVVEIDDVDYRLIIAQRESAVADARYALKVELGRQDVARREWELLGGDSTGPVADSDLALRKPHLEKARADVVAAEAALEAARLQLARTRITAPFNAVIRKTHVETGSQVAVQEPLADLMGTDEYWVQVSVPVDRLKWIAIPDTHRSRGADVRIFYHGGAVRTGRVVKLLSELAQEGRMARLVVAVKDPLGLTAVGTDFPAMLIGEYVRVDIQGQQVPDVYRIPRAALRDNTKIWLADNNGTLNIRPVQILWRDADSVLIRDGIVPGAQLIVSDLATPVAGMAIQVDTDDAKSVVPSANPPARPSQG